MSFYECHFTKLALQSKHISSTQGNNPLLFLDTGHFQNRPRRTSSLGDRESLGRLFFRLEQRSPLLAVWRGGPAVTFENRTRSRDIDQQGRTGRGYTLVAVGWTEVVYRLSSTDLSECYLDAMALLWRSWVSTLSISKFCLPVNWRLGMQRGVVDKRGVRQCGRQRFSKSNEEKSSIFLVQSCLHICSFLLISEHSSVLWSRILQ